MQVRGAIGRDAFDALQLVPILEAGQIVILDNLSVHKSGHTQHGIGAVGAEL